MTSTTAPMDPSMKIKLGLKKDFASGRHSDAKLVVGGREFNVHKNVLSWQSPVFESMLSDRWDMGNNNNNTYDLPEDEPAVVETMLNYIYTNNVEDKFCPASKPVMIFWVHVYAAADKYGLEHMKSVVLSKFKLQLDLRDISAFVAAIVEVNENTADRALWNVIIPKIRDNISFLVNQAEFQQLMLKMPQLNFELLAMLDPKNTGMSAAPSVILNLPSPQQSMGGAAGHAHHAGPGDEDEDEDDMDEDEYDDGQVHVPPGGSSARWSGRGGHSYGTGRRLGD